MVWVRIDEDFYQHPKVVEAGPLGMAMQVAALCYCNRHLTDGFVPRKVAKMLLDLDGLGMHMWSAEMFGGGEDAHADLVISDLLDAGLWVEVEGGYHIHDFHEFQPSKAEVLELREKRAEAGRKGGQAKSQASATADAKQPPSKGSSKRASKTEAKSKPVPVPVPVPQEGQNLGDVSPDTYNGSHPQGEHDDAQGPGSNDPESMRELLRFQPRSA